jgi:hypothetical protein
VRFVLELARREDVRVDLFINPYHADYLAALELSGNWQLLEQWKRALAGLAADFDGASLWDFNGFDRYSSPFLTPDMRAGDSLAWYWEPAHYRAELGEHMIARINDTDCAGRLDKALGARLTPAVIDGHLDALRGQMRNFAARFPAHWRTLAERYQAVLRSN